MFYTILMKQLTEKIYYAEEDILKRIESDFELIDSKDWYILLQNKSDKSYWRLDVWDKYQEQCFVRLESNKDWSEYDDQELRIGLLKKLRGTTSNNCVWKECDKNALTDLTMCEYHAYSEMGLRK